MITKSVSIESTIKSNAWNHRFTCTLQKQCDEMKNLCRSSWQDLFALKIIILQIVRKKSLISKLYANCTRVNKKIIINLSRLKYWISDKFFLVIYFYIANIIHFRLKKFFTDTINKHDSKLQYFRKRFYRFCKNIRLLTIVITTIQMCF